MTPGKVIMTHLEYDQGCAGSNAEILSAGHASSWNDHTKYLQPSQSGQPAHQPAEWQLKVQSKGVNPKNASEAEEAHYDNQEPSQFSGMKPSFVRERTVTNEDRQ